MAATEPIVLGRINESFHQVVASVVQEVLRQLGHRVEIVDGQHEELFAQLGRGQLTLFADSWLPHSQGIFWAEIRDRAIEVGELFTGARYFWAIPCYMSTDVSVISDLSDADIVEEMTTQAIVGAPATSGLSRWSRDVLAAYDLESHGWTYESADVATVIRTVNQRMAAGDWFVTPLWVPQYLDDVFDMKRLEDPLRVFPPADRASILAHAASFAQLPERTQKVLGNIRLAIGHVSEMDALVNLDAMAPLEAAQEWMDENDAIVKAWFNCRHVA